MKRDIRKAVEEIKSAGMEDFLHQDPSTFECDDDKFSHHKCTTGCKCTTGGRCPRTRCTRVKHCTFVTKCTHVKKWTFVTKCTRVRVQKWTFVTKVTRRKECVLVTKRTRRKHCTFVTKCIRFEKKFYWTKRSFCKKCEFFPNRHGHSCDDSCDHGRDCHDDGHKWNDCKDSRHKSSSCKNKKFDHFWYKKRNC
ncbi:spore coat protein G [Bacillus toyonensis]|uniref:exosporium protein ExsB n=1 Tax=Bacillus toyonensis TaxID=155322 RepID=UPI000BFE35C8|nr:exosporium protein ExsB [Bacillus toyonensis]PHB73966.1 spore coat protein G [Bacillus toyonensis]